MNEQKQTAKLIATIAENLPEMTAEQRQRWIGDPKGLQNFLANLVEKRWQEKDGVITFTLPATDGTTGLDWIARTEKKGNRVGDYAKQVLQSKDFQPTIGVTYQVKVLKGELFSDENRITQKIRQEAKKRKLETPNAEVACLIRENFSDKELEQMGLWYIVVMHEPIKDSGGNPDLLGVYRFNDGRWLLGCYDSTDNGWNRGNGFVVAAQQVSA